MSRLSPVLALIGLALSGCVQVSGGLATSNVPIDGPYTPLGRVSGSQCSVRLFGVLAVAGSNDTGLAIAEALNQNPEADALVNVAVNTWNRYWLLGSSHCTEITATAVRRS